MSRQNKYRYRKVALKMWGDEKFSNLTPLPPSGQSLWLFLLVCPLQDSIPGVYRTGRASLAEMIGWELEDFDRAFKEISDQNMVKADWAAKLVWLPNATKFNAPESPSVVIWWSKAWDDIPECPLKIEIFDTLKANIHAVGKGFGEEFDKNFSKPKKTVNQAPNQPAPQTGGQGVAQAATKSASQPDVQADSQPAAQTGHQPEESVNQAPNQPAPQTGGQGVAHQEHKQEHKQEQYEMREGGAGEARGAPPSAPPPPGSGSDSIQEPQPSLEGFDFFRGPAVIDEVEQAVREEQKKTGSRMPVDFVVPEQWITYAKRTRADLPDEQLRSTARAFVRHWLAKSGRDASKTNWLATWLNWVDRERAPTAAGGGGGRQQRLMEPSSFDDDESRRKTLEIAKRFGARVTGMRKTPPSSPDEKPKS